MLVGTLEEARFNNVVSWAGLFWQLATITDLQFGKLSMALYETFL